MVENRFPFGVTKVDIDHLDFPAQRLVRDGRTVLVRMFPRPFPGVLLTLMLLPLYGGVYYILFGNKRFSNRISLKRESFIRLYRDGMMVKQFFKPSFSRASLAPNGL